MYVRDTERPHDAPAQPGGPIGHHFTCDVKLPDNEMISFRFTLHDFMYVLDATYPTAPSGRLRVTSKPLGPHSAGEHHVCAHDLVCILAVVLLWAMGYYSYSYYYTTTMIAAWL